MRAQSAQAMQRTAVRAALALASLLVARNAHAEDSAAALLHEALVARLELPSDQPALPMERDGRDGLKDERHPGRDEGNRGEHGQKDEDGDRRGDRHHGDDARNDDHRGSQDDVRSAVLDDATRRAEDREIERGDVEHGEGGRGSDGDRGHGDDPSPRGPGGSEGDHSGDGGRHH